LVLECTNTQMLSSLSKQLLYAPPPMVKIVIHRCMPLVLRALPPVWLLLLLQPKTPQEPATQLRLDSPIHLPCLLALPLVLNVLLRAKLAAIVAHVAIPVTCVWTLPLVTVLIINVRLRSVSTAVAPTVLQLHFHLVLSFPQPLDHQMHQAQPPQLWLILLMNLHPTLP
jgi:hypothetical protein